MATITRFEDIEAWQTAREVTRLVYALTNEGAFARDFGLRDQTLAPHCVWCSAGVRRAAVSILSNVAEGFESRTQALFIEFLGRAKGSAGELRAQLYVAMDAGYVDQSQFSRLFDLADKSSRQISQFISYLETQPNSRRVREERVEYDV